MSGPEEAALRRELVSRARRLAPDGLGRGTSGNLSARAGDRIYLTPSGIPYEELEPEAISVLDLAGRPLEGRAPSSEAALHLRLYARRPEVGAVVHTHSHFATVFAVLRRPIEPVHYLLAFGGRRIRVAPYACPGSERLADQAAETLGSDRCVLLANHGLLAVGPTLARAYATALYVEEVAALAYHAQALGEPVVLTDAELAEVEALLGSYGSGS